MSSLGNRMDNSRVPDTEHETLSPSGDIEDKTCEKGRNRCDGETDTTNMTDASVSPVFGKEMQNVLVLSLSFLFLFTSYLALQNLQGSLNDEEGLGVISLSCLYGAAIVSCVFAPVVTTVFGVKQALLLAFGAHFTYTVCNFYPSFATLIPSSILLGSLSGPLWSSQGIYMTTCAFSHAKRTGALVYTSLSKMNGVYYTIFNLSNIIGNLVASFVFYQGHYNSTNVNGSLYCGVNDCPGNETEDIIADPEPRVVYILLGVFLGFVTSAIVIVAIFLSPLPTQGTVTKKIIKNSAFSWFKVLIKTDFKFLVPLMCHFAIAEEIIYAEVTKSYVSCPIGIQNVGYVMMAYGVSSCVTSLVFGRLAKYTRRYIVFTVSALIQMSLLVCLYHWSPTDRDTVYIYLFVATWGVCEGLWKITNSAMIGEIFADHVKSVFAVKEGFKSTAFTITFVYSSFLCVYVKLLLSMSFLTLSMLLYYFVEYRFIQRQSRKKGEYECNVETVELNSEKAS